MHNHVLYFMKPNEVCVMNESIPSPKQDEVLVKTHASAISAGTEMLMYRGFMPNNMLLDANFPGLQKSIQYPFKYGYSSVGEIIDTENKALTHLIGKRVFAFNPHESYFCVNENELILLPEDMDSQDALFIPTMETAINFVLDANPQLGENIMILGLGVVGLLTMSLLLQFPASCISAVDHYPRRRKIVNDIGTAMTYAVEEIATMDKQYDLIFELTGNPEALNTAIELSCFEGRIILGSWYGCKQGSIDLGGKFHRHRIQLIASQVSTLASKLQGRWNKKRRLNLAIDMIKKIKPARFISHQFPIAKAMDAYKLLQSSPEETLQVILTY